MIPVQQLNDILRKIIPNGGENSFKIECIYSDGQEYTILKISFFNTHNLHTFGQVCFQHETGEVQSCVYKSRRFRDADNIVDALLDIYNYQKASHYLA